MYLQIYVPICTYICVNSIGDLVEPSDLSVNPAFYGQLHNGGHGILSVAHDPDYRYKVCFCL